MSSEEQKLLDEYEIECRDIEEMCIEEGYPGRGSNYELRCATIWEDYYLPSLRYINPTAW